MKKKVKKTISLVVLFAGLVLMFSCCDMSGIEGEENLYDITFINNSSYDLTISDAYGEDFEEFSISAGETKTIESNSSYVIFDISVDTEDVDIDYDRNDQTITLYDREEYDVTIVNNSDFDLTVDSALNRFDSFTISPNETKVIKASSTTIFLNLSGDTGEYSMSYERDRTTYTIYQYEYYLEYEITGTATSVSVTLNNPSGNTEQYNPVLVPHTYSYKSFPDDFYYISAQNQNSSGSVTVSIYQKGKLIERASSEGAYVIATASGSK